jgi:hypothetical protein
LSGDGINYQRFVEDALRDAVRRLLAEVAAEGLPGEHYFYIAFRTAHPGVVMPRSLRDLYPEEMRIILQNQFWNLEVEADFFAVELSFSASRQRLLVPFTALTTFADPSVEFALRFSPVPAAPAAAAGPFASPAATGPQAIEPAQAAAGGRQVVAGAPALTPTLPALAPPAPGASERRAPGDVIRFDPSRRK